MGNLSLRQITAELKRMDKSLKRTDEAFRAGTILLASCQEGTDPMKLWVFTGYPEFQVRKVCKNLENGGVFSGSEVVGEWRDTGCSTSFWLDVSVGLGQLVRTASPETGELLYSLSDAGIRNVENMGIVKKKK